MTESALKVEIENLSEVKRKLKIEVPSTEVTQEVDRAYRELGKRAKVKGFRPGKVPRSVLEMYYRKEIDHDVSETLVRRSLGEALKDKGLEAINLSWPEPAPPVVAGEDYCYSVELEVAPEFTAEDYLGLKLEAPEVVVTDAEVEARLEEIRQGNALLKPPAEDRGVQEGDFVVLDHQAHFAGQPVEGGKSEGAYLEVGSGKFNAEFEGNLVGLKAGAEARFPVSLPDDFANPLIAGKVIDFAVKVQEVKEKVVPELDDAFAQNLGGNFQTLADLRTAVREDIIKGKERERQALPGKPGVGSVAGPPSIRGAALLDRPGTREHAAGPNGPLQPARHEHGQDGHGQDAGGHETHGRAPGASQAGPVPHRRPGEPGGGRSRNGCRPGPDRGQQPPGRGRDQEVL